jgi:hypothetical protein
LLPLLMLMVFVLELVLVLVPVPVLVLVLVVLLLLLVVVPVLVLVAATDGGCGAAVSDSVCFKKLNGFFQVKYARIFWIYLSKNDDSIYFKYC